jgi:hypothetical protein
MRLLDPSFKYFPAARTDVTATWRRFGVLPTERRSRKTGSDDSAVVDIRSAGVVPSQPRRSGLPSE